VTFAIRGKCDTCNQRFSMVIHRNYYTLYCTSLHKCMPSIKTCSVEEDNIAVYQNTMQIGSNKTLLEKLPIYGDNTYRLLHVIFHNIHFISPRS
jgi:hypothetical protein